ncbi:MAG: ATPase [Lewinellaceae bacterium]|nr:ATPase [Lewinellaceae bacterium]
MENNAWVTKASGEQVVFAPEKLLHSLRRAGAGRERAEAIVREVTAQLHAGMTTKQIYRMAHKMLRKEARYTAARYSLKQALLELGPSGYPFEVFIARLLEAEGMRVQIGQIRAGKCVSHEVDVFGEADGRVLVGECKFHNRQGLVSDVKVPLYIHSRFRDLSAGFLSAPEWAGRKFESWVFTNTRFTDDALQYGRCSGMHLIGWDTPFDYGLRDWVDRTGLHPLTCLTSLTRHEKNKLLDQRVVLARELLQEPEKLDIAGIAPGRVRGILKEAEGLCG